MRAAIGQTLLLLAAWIESLAVTIGGQPVAADYLNEHNRIYDIYLQQELSHWESEAKGKDSELAEVRKALERESESAKVGMRVTGGQGGSYMLGRYDLARKLLSELFW